MFEDAKRKKLWRLQKEVRDLLDNKPINVPRVRVCLDQALSIVTKMRGAAPDDRTLDVWEAYYRDRSL
jgi:hypothetical protein